MKIRHLAPLGLALATLFPAASFGDNITIATASQYITGQGWAALGINSTTTGRYYKFGVVPGRSYCAETAAGDFNTDNVNTSVIVYKTGHSIIGLSGPKNEPNGASDGGGGRVCWIADVGETDEYIEILDAAGAGTPRRFRVAETSLWAPWFFSGNGFEAFILIKNTTNEPQTVAVFLYQTTGAQNGAISTTIPANGSLNYQVSGAPFFLASATGTVQISHTGAPGALVAGVTSLSFATGVSFDVTASPRQDFRH